MAPSLLTSVVVMALIVGPGMSSVVKPRPQKWELVFRSPFLNRDAATSAAARNIARLMKQMVGSNVCSVMREDCHLFGERCCSGLRCSTRWSMPCDTTVPGMCLCLAVKADDAPTGEHIWYR
ncbi:hypothetical protein LSAT2_009628 [Lamellibrachia satsuma]|nr:hypothetical protein LSAT2_009628 [Lamellibrachia satsuma]